MENFVMYNPTRLHFGRDVIKGLGKAVSEFGNRVLLVYGGGSILKNGIYDQVINQLNAVGMTVWEHGGIRPNPVIEDVDAAAALGRRHNVDVIVAVGGGSVIDSGKAISITIPYQGSGWDFYAGRYKPSTAVPLIAVLTLAATGTEMNPFAVVQNRATMQKLGGRNDLMYPRHSFLDPAYTFSVSREYTAYGIADLMAHCLEAYFDDGDASLSDRFVFSILQEAVVYGPPLLDRLHDYELRARIMYAATAALNRTMTMNGRKNAGDWGVHAIGHVLSLLYDLPHGATLSIAFPAWMKLQAERIPDRIAFLGKNIFGVSTPEETIVELEMFFKSLGCPIRLVQVGISADKKEEILEGMVHNQVSGNYHKLTVADYERILEFAL
ncbi:MAG: iron-containing alcohol dehydrogenase [Bacteroidales bacterium]|nr:iron-containing alcohol dehydrogenase [Bacteroidales bacterium]